MRRILRENGLSMSILFLLIFLAGQAVAGMYEYNDEQQQHGQPTVNFIDYLGSSHFLEATMENWESDFLQMFAFVALTACLYQKGSTESRDPIKKNLLIETHASRGRRKMHHGPFVKVV